MCNLAGEDGGRSLKLGIDIELRNKNSIAEIKANLTEINNLIVYEFKSFAYVTHV